MTSKKSLTARLRHRVALQSEVETADTYGGYSRSWQHIAYLWAEIIPLQGLQRDRESTSGGQVQASLTHKITLRYREGVSPAHRLVFDGRIFNIRSVINRSEDHYLLELLAEEGVAP